MGMDGQGKRRQKQDHGAGLHRPKETWVAGQGHQDRERRYGRWSPAVVDPFPGGQAVQYQKRGENQVQIAVQLSIRLAYGEGVRTWRVTGKIQKIFEAVVRG